MELKVKFSILPETFAICRLDREAPVPDWAAGDSLSSITRTAEELSIVCPQTRVPEEIKRNDGWRCLKIEGILDFSLTGVIANLTRPLGNEGISVLVISTYNTEYLLLKEQHLEKAITVLAHSGHGFQRETGGNHPNSY